MVLFEERLLGRLSKLGRGLDIRGFFAKFVGIKRLKMKKPVRYPVGQQSFEQLREGGFLYVDKTRYLELIANGGQYYFLGRPRRFGKSLFLSTLKCFFEGRRELFKGLYIDSTNWAWQPHPVLYLDLNNRRYKDETKLDFLLNDFFEDYESLYGIEPGDKDYSGRFRRLIRTAHEKTGKPVVILVDEYDKPLVNNLHNREQFEMYRDRLAELYSNFKNEADHIRLVFLTGVSRFGKLSVFSGLNNISDISLANNYAAICGITEQELLDNFAEGIETLGEFRGKTRVEVVCQLKRRYDGYHFAEVSPDIYNPFSLLNTFAQNTFQNYWIQSATPSLLVEQLKRTRVDIQELMNVEVGENGLSGLDLDSVSPVALFYQTGYLTIKGYDERGRIFRLGIPNEEVKEGFLEYILPYYANIHNGDSQLFAYRLLREMEDGKVDDFMKRLESMFAGMPYDLRTTQEHDVRNAFFILFTLLGIDVDSEVRTSDGRIDILVRTDKYVYIMELKYDRSPEEALAQIRRKEYALPWAIDHRTVIAVGINYSSEKRRMDGWLAERL